MRQQVVQKNCIWPLCLPYRGKLHDRPPGTVSDYTHRSESSKSNVGPRYVVERQRRGFSLQ